MTAYSREDYPKRFEWIEELVEDNDWELIKKQSFNKKELIHFIIFSHACQNLKHLNWALSKLSDRRIIRLINKDWGIDIEFVFCDVPFDRACRLAKCIDTPFAYYMLWFEIRRNIHVISCVRRWRKRFAQSKRI